MKAPTRGPLFACLYPGLCDVARKHGYALAIHGTLVSDMDLIAVPWTDEVVDAIELRDALMNHIGAVGYDEFLQKAHPKASARQVAAMVMTDCGRTDGGTNKPHGRVAWNLYLVGGTKVDLSVMPREVHGPVTMDSHLEQTP